MSCHASFPLSQDEFNVSASSFCNTLSHCLPSRAKTEAFNPHHCHRLPSSDCLSLTLYCYKKIISNLATLSTTQSRLYFTSSIARAPYHRSSTCRCRSLSPLSHTHCPSTQQHPRWQTCRPSFASIIMWIYIKNILKYRNIARGYKLVSRISEEVLQ
jgi:hypothetical protein